MVLIMKSAVYISLVSPLVAAVAIALPQQNPVERPKDLPAASVTFTGKTKIDQEHAGWAVYYDHERASGHNTAQTSGVTYVYRCGKSTPHSYVESVLDWLAQVGGKLDKCNDDKSLNPIVDGGVAGCAARDKTHAAIYQTSAGPTGVYAKAYKDAVRFLGQRCEKTWDGAQAFIIEDTKVKSGDIKLDFDKEGLGAVSLRFVEEW